MRTVWKDVLASLVEGRKPGEETTLWIQRQIINSNGVAELEALHQIPVKWLQDVTFLDYSTDNRFSLRVYNLNEDFIFRCPKDPSAAENWMVTLRSAKDAAIQKKNAGGMGRNSAHQDRYRDEKKSAENPQADVPPPSACPPPAASQPRPQPQPATPTAPPPTPSGTMTTTTSKVKRSIKELRAIAHGAGIQTIGLERGQLERIVADLEQRQHPAAARATKAPEPQPDPTEERRRHESEANARPSDEATQSKDVEDTEEKEHERTMAEERRRQDEEHQKMMAERVRRQQEAMRKQHEEEERARLARERQMREEEEMRQRAAQQQAEQQRRQQEEAMRRQQEAYRQQQEEWQRRQAEEEQRRRQAEEAQRRQQEEAYRRHREAQRWQASGHHPGGQPPPGWQQPHQQHSPPFGSQGFPQRPPGGAPPSGGQQPQSSVDGKYAKMAAQQDESTSIQHIKHAILVHWALQPPMRQGLRRIEDLICSVHSVFPPAFGVPGHEHFGKWKAVSPAEVDDDDKLEKKVKKLRFFLHPDKLPKDLTTDQSFMCRMLWDIISDALEQHNQKKEDLGWIHN